MSVRVYSKVGYPDDTFFATAAGSGRYSTMLGFDSDSRKGGDDPGSQYFKTLTLLIGVLSVSLGE